MPIPQTGLGLAINEPAAPGAATDDGSGRQGLSCCKREENMPDNVIQPTISPPRRSRPAVLESLRAIVGDKGLILDEQDKKPFRHRLAWLHSPARPSVVVAAGPRSRRRRRS